MLCKSTTNNRVNLKARFLIQKLKKNKKKRGVPQHLLILNQGAKSTDHKTAQKIINV